MKSVTGIYEVCYHGNQRPAVLMTCKNKEETVLAYDPIHLDYIQSTLDTSNFKGLSKICRDISSSR